jgi:type III pantothenate kinase
MLLAIDVGNTETVIGLFDLSGSYADGEKDAGVGAGHDEKQHAIYLAGLVHHWRTGTVPERTADEYAMNLFHLLGLVGLQIASTVTGIAVTSSVPSAATALKEMASRWLPGIKLIVLEPGLRSGMPILYEDPREVGPDRIANAIGAFSIYGGPCIVADLGTATTVDGISADGEYLGGAIMPGVSISMDALFAHAAALRQVSLTKPKSVIGRSTAESIRSGILYGYAGQLDSMCGLFRQELGEHATVVATGGLAELIVPYCQSVDHLNSWLTLYGLKLVYLHSTGTDPSDPSGAGGTAGAGSPASAASIPGTSPASAATANITDPTATTAADPPASITDPPITTTGTGNPASIDPASIDPANDERRSNAVQ